MLVKKKVTVGLHVLADCLIRASVNTVYIVCYGMKLPYAMGSSLMNLDGPDISATRRFGIGRLVYTDYIPLFGLDKRMKGTVYAMC